MENKGIIYNPIDGLTVKTYDNSYKFLHDGVGGYFERVPISMFETKHIDVFVNEEGKFNGMKHSAVMLYKGKPYDYLMGNLVFTKCDRRGNTVSLTDKDIDFIKKTLDSTTYLIDFSNGTMLPTFNY